MECRERSTFDAMVVNFASSTACKNLQIRPLESILDLVQDMIQEDMLT